MGMTMRLPACALRQKWHRECLGVNRFFWRSGGNLRGVARHSHVARPPETAALQERREPTQCGGYWTFAWIPSAVSSSGEIAPVTGMLFCIWYCSMAPAHEAARPSIGPV